MFGAPRGGRLRHRREDRCERLRAGLSEGQGRAEQERAPGRTEACPGPGGRKDWAGGAETHPGPDGSVPRAGRQEGLGRRSRNAPRAGRERAGPAEQKRAPGRQIRTAPRPSGLFHAADQPQGVSAAESPRRRRRTRRSGTPRGPAPSGRGSRRRWPRCRVRPAGRRFGRRFRPDYAAAAARQPAA